jgi:hypothetical protein
MPGLTTTSFLPPTDTPPRARNTEEAAKSASPLLEDVRVSWRGPRLLLELWFTREVTAGERSEAARLAAEAVRAWIGPEAASYQIRARAGRAGAKIERRRLGWLEP